MHIIGLQFHNIIMAFAAKLGSAVQNHVDAVWVLSVAAARTVAVLALYAFKFPGAFNAFQIMLVALGPVTGGVALPAVSHNIFFTIVVC